MYTIEDKEDIEDGEFEEIHDVSRLFNDDISIIGEPDPEPPSPPEVIKITDLSEEDIQLIEESQMDEPHDNLNEELLDPTPRKPMTKREIFNAISAAHKSGAISSKDKARMLREMGVSKSDFTQTKTTKSSKNKKRKNQKLARRKNRK